MIRTAEIVGALALAGGASAGLPGESGLRTAILAARLAKARGLGSREIRDSYWAGAMRFAGCTAYAHEAAQIAGGDDIAFLSTYADVDFGSPRRVMARTVARLGRGAAAGARIAAVARFLSSPGEAKHVATSHCALAVSLSRELGLGARVGAALDQLYERWDGRGDPRRLDGERIDEVARVLHVAHVLEVFQRIAGTAGALDELRRRSGAHFDPELVAYAIDAAEGLLAGVADAPSVWDVYLDEEPRPRAEVEPERVRELALAFARFTDLKSPFTLGHSTGVARLAAAAAESAGLPEDERTLLETAALVHDLGRVAIPNGIWDKPGSLNAVEWEQVRLHSYHTERMLAQAEPLRALAEVACCAHERLDGRGYPRRAVSASLPRVARLLAAADAMHAMGEERAHRPALPRDARASALRAEAADGKLDRDAVRAVLEASGAVATDVRGSWPAGLTDREVDVLRLLARGRTNKEIAQALGISPRTVQTHVERVFDKTGGRTRAAAALFAVEHDLVR